MKAPDAVRDKVMETIGQWFAALARRDANLALTAFAPSDDIFGLTADTVAPFMGRDGIKRCFLGELATIDQLGAAEWTEDYAAVAMSEAKVAWAAVGMIARFTKDNQVVEIPQRLTAVLSLEGDRWLLQQLHISATSQRTIVQMAEALPAMEDKSKAGEVAVDWTQWMLQQGNPADADFPGNKAAPENKPVDPSKRFGWTTWLDRSEE